MIYHPQPGQRVRLRYRRKFCHLFPYHGRSGVVSVSGGRGGPINALVVLDDGKKVVVPRGNLEIEKIV